MKTKLCPGRKGTHPSMMKPLSEFYESDSIYLQGEDRGHSVFCKACYLDFYGSDKGEKRKVEEDEHRDSDQGSGEEGRARTEVQQEILQ